MKCFAMPVPNVSYTQRSKLAWLGEAARRGGIQPFAAMGGVSSSPALGANVAEEYLFHGLDGQAVGVSSETGSG